jgi:hypothetical protein
MSAPIRIPRTTLDGWRSELSNWMDADAFRLRVDQIIRPLSRQVFFGQAGLAFLRDAWIALQDEARCRSRDPAAPANDVRP